MIEVFDLLSMISDFYRGWKMGNRIVSFFSKEDETDAILAQMGLLINSAMEEESFDSKLSLVDRVFKLSDKIYCQKKYQKAVGGYTLLMGQYILAMLYWQNNLWNIEAKKTVNEYFNEILKYCSQVENISVTMFTDNPDLVKDVISRTSKLAKQVRETKRMMHKHYRRVDKALHPWKYTLMWLIPLALVLLTGWTLFCYYYL